MSCLNSPLLSLHLLKSFNNLTRTSIYCTNFRFFAHVVEMREQREQQFIDFVRWLLSRTLIRSENPEGAIKQQERWWSDTAQKKISHLGRYHGHWKVGRTLSLHQPPSSIAERVRSAQATSQRFRGMLLLSTLVPYFHNFSLLLLNLLIRPPSTPRGVFPNLNVLRWIIVTLKTRSADNFSVRASFRAKQCPIYLWSLNFGSLWCPCQKNLRPLRICL